MHYFINMNKLALFVEMSTNLRRKKLKYNWLVTETGKWFYKHIRVKQRSFYFKNKWFDFLKWPPNLFIYSVLLAPEVGFFVLGVASQHRSDKRYLCAACHIYIYKLISVSHCDRYLSVVMGELCDLWVALKQQQNGSGRFQK